MLWDASQAYGACAKSGLEFISSITRGANDFLFFFGVTLANGRYDLGIKNALAAAGGTGFTFPSCTAAAYVSGSSYTASQQVSYQGYVCP